MADAVTSTTLMDSDRVAIIPFENRFVYIGRQTTSADRTAKVA